MDDKQRVHEGRNIKRLREMLGIKQETLAYELGEKWTQKKVSQLEAKEKIELDILEQVARLLNVNSEIIQKDILEQIYTVFNVNPETTKNFDDETVFSIINNTYYNTSNDNSILNASSVNYQPNFSTVENMANLYERLLLAEKEKIAYLEKLLDKK